jgi:hypothetical protein
MSVKAILPSEAAAACASWVCDDPVPNGRYGRSALLWKSAERRQRPKVQLCSPDEAFCRVAGVTIPEDGKWGYVDATPVTESQFALLRTLDQFATELAHEKCVPWFGKPLPLEVVASMYKPILAQDKVVARFRFDPSSCNIWCVQPGGRSYSDGSPSDLVAGAAFLPCLTVNGIYFKAREMGLSLTCTDMLVYPEAGWPFQLASPLVPDVSAAPATLPEHEEGCERTAPEHIAPIPSVACPPSDTSTR